MSSLMNEKVSNKDYKDYKKKDLTMIKNEDTAEDNHLDLLDQREIKEKRNNSLKANFRLFCESRYRDNSSRDDCYEL